GRHLPAPNRRGASKAPRDRQPLRRSSHRRNVVGGGEWRSRLALLFFGLRAVQAQQELIQFADSLQPLFELAIVFDGLANLWNLAGTQAHLAGLSAGITHVEDPERMALTTGAFQAPRRMTDCALEQ